MKKNVNISDLQAGDVVLCKSNSSKFGIKNPISKFTESDYSHAAICLNSELAAEIHPLSRVKKVQISELISRYEYVAIFRQPDAWSSKKRIRSLNYFIENLISRSARYNFWDLRYFLQYNKSDNDTLEKLDSFFSGEYCPPSSERARYFCSELVVCCFIFSGFIDASAAIIYEANKIPPGFLGRDATFGTFYGYITNKKNFSIPETDEFYNEPPYEDIFGST